MPVPGTALLPLLLLACEGPQSALAPAGRDAERIAELWWVMAAGALLIWAVVFGAAVYASRGNGSAPERHARLLIVGGGVAFPTVVLAALLLYGLSMMPPLLDLGPQDGVKITVTGEQWWWRVRYEGPGGEPVELANELRLPLGHRVPVRLESPDVIHALWIPSLAGKIDMIPGRTNWMALEPTRTGTFRGACAEYCGTSHAKMNLYAVVLDEPDFDAWLAQQRRPAAAPEGALAQRGQQVFLASGCGACHAVRGTPADGTVGPELTHVGGRVSVGAGLLDNDVDGFVTWLAETGEIKPDVHMPTFDMLGDGDLRALAAYLEGLR